MIKDNSGKFFRFKLDFGFGFGFGEVYDFTDIHSADGTKVFVYNRIDSDAKKSYNLTDITNSGINLGPISLYRYPNSRGIGAWKYLLKSDNHIIEDTPITKESPQLTPWTYDWSMVQNWYKSDRDPVKKSEFLPYEQVRHLETRILNSNSSIVKKATMKLLIDNDRNVAEYYDLFDIGNANMFVQLVNTYYSTEKCRKLIQLVTLLNGA